MKILIVSQFYYPEKFTISDIASTLKSFGHEVSVITGKPNYGYGEIIPSYKKIKFEVIDGVDVYRVNLYPRKESKLSIYRNYLSFYLNAKRFARHIDSAFDVVLSVSLSPVISIAPAIVYAKKHHIPHVLYCLDLWPESTVTTGAVKKDSCVYKILYKWSQSLYRKCDEIIVSSPSFKDYFYNILFLRDQNLKFVPQPALIPKKHLEPIVFEHKYNIVYAGNIGRIQLVDLLIKSMNLISKDFDICLHIIGMGSESEHIKQLVTELKLTDRVHVLGPKPVEEAARYYGNCDALIVSLKEEGYAGKTIPNKLIQYLHFGKPIIGVISGDGKQVLINAGGAFIAEPNENSISQCIRNVCLLDLNKKKELGEHNARYFENNFNLIKISHQIEKELSDSLLKKK